MKQIPLKWTIQIIYHVTKIWRFCNKISSVLENALSCIRDTYFSFLVYLFLLTFSSTLLLYWEYLIQCCKESICWRKSKLNSRLLADVNYFADAVVTTRVTHAIYKKALNKNKKYAGICEYFQKMGEMVYGC